MTEHDLLNLKQEITEKKGELNKLEAKKGVILEELKKKFNVTTLAAAQKKADKMATEIDEQNNQIEELLVELEEKLEENG